MSDIEKIRKIRTGETLNLPGSPFLKSHLTLSDGSEVPLALRNYQKVGVANMLVAPRTCLGDGTGLGKTLMVLSTASYLWMREPDYIPIVLTTKSAVFQWASECEKFLIGIEPVVVHGDPYKRSQAYETFFLGESINKRVLLLTYDTLFRDIDPSIVKDKSVKVDKKIKEQHKAAKAEEAAQKDRVETLLAYLQEVLEGKRFEDSEYAMDRLNHRHAKRPKSWEDSDENALNAVLREREKLQHMTQIVRDLSAQVNPAMSNPGILHYLNQLRASNPSVKFLLAMDEAHKVKNHKSQVHEKVKLVGDLCERVIAMTATPVKNRLMEFFGIFHIVEPRLFPKITAFQNEYCIMKLQRIGGGRQVPVVVGYKNLDKFVEKIEPFYLARAKHEVAKELPELISTTIECELSDEQEMLYDMAENHVGEEEEDNAGALLASLTMCQQAANAPQLILDDEGNPFTGKSSKIEALLDFLEEAEDQKVIIFSRFEKMITQVADHLKENKIKFVRITGKENSAKYRQEAKEIFQDTNSGVNVVMITLAGAESLNLQAAEHFIFLDMPFSYGDYNQLIGRMIRIGSTHKTVMAHHMLGKRINGDKTIDHHVLEILKGKKKLIDKVAGESGKGMLEMTEMESDSSGNFLLDLFNRMSGGQKPDVKKKAATKAKPKAAPKVVAPKEPEEKQMTLDIDFSGI